MKHEEREADGTGTVDDRRWQSARRAPASRRGHRGRHERRIDGGVKLLRRVYLPDARQPRQKRRPRLVDPRRGAAQRLLATPSRSSSSSRRARPPGPPSARRGGPRTSSVGTRDGAASPVVGASAPAPTGAASARLRGARPAPARRATGAAPRARRTSADAGMAIPATATATTAPRSLRRRSPSASMSPSFRSSSGGREPSPSRAPSDPLCSRRAAADRRRRLGADRSARPRSSPAASSPPTATARSGAATWATTSFTRSCDHGRVEPPALEAFRREARDHGLSDAGRGPDDRAQDLRGLPRGRLSRGAHVRAHDVVLRRLDARRGRAPSRATSSTRCGPRGAPAPARCTSSSSGRAPRASRRSSSARRRSPWSARPGCASASTRRTSSPRCPRYDGGPDARRTWSGPSPTAPAR